MAWDVEMLDVVSRKVMGLIKGVWNGDGQAFNAFRVQIEMEIHFRPYRGLKLVFLLAGCVDTFQN